MKRVIIVVTSVLVVAIGAWSAARAQEQQPLPVPGYAAAKDIPGAHELPDPRIMYKVVFSVAKSAAKPDSDVNPTLQAIARYLNTLAKNGVPPDHRRIAAVFHQGGTDAVLTNAEFRSRYNGKDNPNLALIEALKTAGVDMRVCGQALTAKKIDPSAVVPQIQVDLWAMTSMVNLQLRGYVRVGD